MAHIQKKEKRHSHVETEKKEKKCAFAEMMKSAKAPGAFEIVYNHYADNQDARLTRLLDHWYDYSHCYDETFQEAMDAINIAAFETADEDRYNIERILYDDRNRELSSTEARENIEALPLPSTEPDPDAYIRKITVHFRIIVDSDEEEEEEVYLYRDPVDSLDALLYDDDSYCEYEGRDSRIVGYVIEYSDGVETEVGNLLASECSASVSLEGNEHIVRIYQYVLRDESAGEIDQVDFISNDRILVFRHGRLYEEHQYCDSRRSLDDPNLAIPKGTVLRALVWSPKDMKISGVVSQAHPEYITRRKSHFSTEAVPDPRSEIRKLKTDLWDSNYAELRRICHAAQMSLLEFFMQDREEALETIEQQSPAVLFLRKDMTFYRKIDEERTALLQIHDELKRTRLLKKRDALVAHVRHKVTKTQLSSSNRSEFVLNKYNELYEKCSARHEQLILHGILESGSILCKDCFSPFRPACVRSGLRCEVPFCFASSLNCGCSVAPCERCHASICERHSDAHELSCASSFPTRCGRTNGRTGLQSGLCGHSMSHIHDLKKCCVCSVMACEQCRVNPCLGRERSEAWCWLNGITGDPPRIKSEKCDTFVCIICRDSIDFSRWCRRYCKQRCWDCLNLQSDDESDPMDSDYMSESESTDESLQESMETLNLSASSEEFEFMG